MVHQTNEKEKRKEKELDLKRYNFLAMGKVI
jgi:hypothetical protein